MSGKAIVGPVRRSDGGSARILVVEPQARARALLVRALVSEGYAVACVEGDAGSIAVRALPKPNDLVVLGLPPSALDAGMALLRAFHRERPELPILILAAGSESATVLRGIEAGACDYLAEPFSLEELILRVRVQVARRARARADDASMLRAGSLVLDVAQHQARLGGLVVDLSAREFCLLHLLARHLDEPVDRTRLLADVWGYRDPCSNVVEVCIRRLRRKLGGGVGIETVRGAGYRLAGAGLPPDATVSS